VSERRCSNCGALVSADAQWCGQCLERLEPPPGQAGNEPIPGTGPSGNGGPPDGEEPEPATASAVPRGATAAPPPAGAEAAALAGGVRAGERGIVWDCPTCGNENPLESSVCGVCGTTFASVVEPKEESAPSVDPGRAATFSLFFPGLGHYLAGRTADAVARGIVFLFAVATGVVILVGGIRNGFGPLLPLMVICLGAAAALYVVSTVDAGRVAHGERQLLTPRMLLYGATGLILVTLVFFIVAATTEASRG
jgi:hypothetical protein